MGIGNSLFTARKGKGLSQEAVAEKLGVSRQTISKWETGETLPDIQQSKRLAVLYGLSLDELIEFDPDVQEIQDMICRTSKEACGKTDWTKLWGQQYPILLRYRQEMDPSPYAAALKKLLEALEQETGYPPLDAFLVLKDILAGIWKERS